MVRTSSYSAGNGTAFLGVGRGVKLTTHLHLIPRLRMCGVMIPLPHTHSWRAERLPCIGCAKWDVLLKRLNRGPEFWDLMMPLFRVGHYFRNILRMEADSSSEILEAIYALHGVRSQMDGLIYSR